MGKIDIFGKSTCRPPNHYHIYCFVIAIFVRLEYPCIIQFKVKQQLHFRKNRYEDPQPYIRVNFPIQNGDGYAPNLQALYQSWFFLFIFFTTKKTSAYSYILIFRRLECSRAEWDPNQKVRMPKSGKVWKGVFRVLGPVFLKRKK